MTATATAPSRSSVYEAYVRARADGRLAPGQERPGYRRAYVGYMAAAAVARAFDPAAQALEAEMKQRVMGLRYTGNMMSPTVAPDSFWPMADTLEKQIEAEPGPVPLRGLGPSSTPTAPST